MWMTNLWISDDKNNISIDISQSIKSAHFNCMILDWIYCDYLSYLVDDSDTVGVITTMVMMEMESNRILAN